MPADLPNVTLYAVPAFVLFIVAEMLYGWKKGKVAYHGTDTITSMLMGLGSQSLKIGSIAIPGMYIWENFRFFDPGYGWPVILLAFFLDDHQYYWVHRFGHRIRWMWAAHVIHHSSQHYNLSTALRQSWTSDWTPAFLLAIPLYLLGFHPLIVAFVSGVNLIYQFWIHTEAIDKLPRWFEYIFNTPSHHRVHHGKNPQYLDANYAGVFIIWDRLYGTFIPEDKNQPVDYGLVHDLGTFNPLRVAFHEWIAIIKDITKTKGLGNKVMMLVGPPGWGPEGTGKTSAHIKKQWQERQQQQKIKIRREAENLND